MWVFPITLTCRTPPPPCASLRLPLTVTRWLARAARDPMKKNVWADLAIDNRGAEPYVYRRSVVLGVSVGFPRGAHVGAPRCCLRQTDPQFMYARGGRVGFPLVGSPRRPPWSWRRVGACPAERARLRLARIGILGEELTFLGSFGLLLHGDSCFLGQFFFRPAVVACGVTGSMVCRGAAAITCGAAPRSAGAVALSMFALAVGRVSSPPVLCATTCCHGCLPVCRPWKCARVGGWPSFARSGCVVLLAGWAPRVASRHVAAVRRVVSPPIKKNTRPCTV